MEPYWIDSNIFIDAANGPYAFSRAPTFWAALDKKLNDGLICTSEMVYRELVTFGDQLSGWVKNRKQNGLYREVDELVQTNLTTVVDYVATCGKYDLQNANEFFSGADPWIIAHVLASGGTLVTNETALRPQAKKVRIPDICAEFDVRVISGYDMLDELDIVL
jgi:predicted nucleic acid-binding protein